MTEEVTHLMQKLSESDPRIISGIRDERIKVLDENDLFRIYASSGKVFAVTDSGEYSLRLRLRRTYSTVHAGMPRFTGKICPSQLMFPMNL